MDIKACKQCIENKVNLHTFMIFQEADTDFISRQYMQAIAEINQQEIEYIDSIDPYLIELDSIFLSESEENSSRLHVLKVDMFEHTDQRCIDLRNVFVICKKLGDQASKLFSSYIVKMPKLESWQIKDYVYSTAEGVPEQLLDKVISLCNGNIERLDNELSKLKLFAPTERKYLLDSMIKDGAFGDLTDYSVFNVTNALLKKDIEALKNYMNLLHVIDINEFGLITILTKNLRDMISVQLSSNPTPETIGLDSRKIYALKKQSKVFTNEQLTKLYLKIADLDRAVKNGEFPAPMLINYMILKVLTI